MLFKIALVIFSAFAIKKTINQYRQHHVSKYWLVVFSSVWIAVAIVAVMPQFSDVVASVVGVGRGADLAVYSAIVVLLYSNYRLIIGRQRQSEEFTELVRQIALNGAKTPPQS